MTEDPAPYAEDDDPDDNPIMRAFLETLTKRERLTAINAGIEIDPDVPWPEPAPDAFDNDPWGNNLKRYPWKMG